MRYLCLVCRMCVSRFLKCRIQVIVIPRRDSNQGLRVSVYLNWTHILNHSATTAGCHSTLMLQLFCVLAFFAFYKFPIQNLVKTCIQIPTLNQKTDNKENSRNLFRELARFLESVAVFVARPQNGKIVIKLVLETACLFNICYAFDLLYSLSVGFLLIE